jgi:hypothetical protein
VLTQEVRVVGLTRRLFATDAVRLELCGIHRIPPGLQLSIDKKGIHAARTEYKFKEDRSRGKFVKKVGCKHWV